MKITVIHGSMLKGKTYSVTQAALAHLWTYDGVQITEISVADMGLPFCCSCHTCFGKGEEYCPHSAVVSSVAKVIEDCDGLIMRKVFKRVEENNEAVHRD